MKRIDYGIEHHYSMSADRPRLFVRYQMEGTDKELVLFAFLADDYDDAEVQTVLSGLDKVAQGTESVVGWAIAQAIATEREACATVAAMYGAAEVAAAIRARGNNANDKP